MRRKLETVRKPKEEPVFGTEGSRHVQTGGVSQETPQSNGGVKGVEA